MIFRNLVRPNLGPAFNATLELLCRPTTESTVPFYPVLLSLAGSPYPLLS